MTYLLTKLIFLGTRHIEKRYLRIMDWAYTREYSRLFRASGTGIRLHYPCRITGPERMEVGNNVHINRGALIRAEGGLRIGDNVHIARNLTIYTINHNYEGQALPYDHTMIRESVVIERNVWIGINVTIVPGVRIAEGAIVAAGSVVSHDVPPLTIVGGHPLRLLKARDEEHYRRLETQQKYGGPSGYPICV